LVVGSNVVDLAELISYNYTVSLCVSTLGAMSPLCDSVTVTSVAVDVTM